MKRKHKIHRNSGGCVPSDKVGCGRAKLDKNLYDI